MRTLLLPVLLALFLQTVATTVLADDHDRAREAVAAGQVLPLAMIVDRATAAFGGTVVDADFEGGDDADEDHHRDEPRRMCYRIKLLTTDGRILKLAYDAVTGELIDQRGRHRERHRGGHDEDKDD